MLEAKKLSMRKLARLFGSKSEKIPPKNPPDEKKPKDPPKDPPKKMEKIIMINILEQRKFFMSTKLFQKEIAVRLALEAISMKLIQEFSSILKVHHH